MQSKVTISTFSNPFNLSQKDVEYVDAGSTFVDYLKVRYPEGFKRPTRVLLNGSKLDIDNFDTVLNENDIVEVQIIPQDPVTAAIIVGVVAAGITAVVILNSQPEIPSLESPDTLSALKDTGGNAYNLRQQSNVARLKEPIPTQYGKLKWFPDLAAAPWFENTDNERYLNQLFCLGWGQFTISSIRLGDIALDDFPGITYEVYGPNEEVDLFHDNMFTVPALKNFNIYQSNRYSRSDNDFDFSKTNSKVTGPSSSNFNEFIEVGDTILIECTSTPGFEGEFLVTAVTSSEITLDDVSSWPGDNTNPGVVDIYNAKFVQYLLRGSTDLDYPDSIGSRSIFDGYTPGYITSPVGTEAEVFYVDIEFPDGVYDVSSGDYEDQTANFQALLYPLDENNEFVYTLQTETGEGMTGSGTTWRPSDSSERWWDETADFTFYDNGVEIDEADIASIDYGTDGSGAHVVFTGSKSGPITYDGVSKYLKYYPKSASFTGASPLPQRVSLEFDMTTLGGSWDGPGRFLFYVGRSNGYDWNTTERIDYGVITGLRSKLTPVEKYGPYTMLAVRIKATPDIDSTNSRKVNVIATRKLLQWNGSAWTGPTATRSIAWALADIWMATYGASRPASSLDLATLLTLDTLWTSRGDTFDGVFDSSITVWEALQKVARCGRCRPVFDGSTLTFVRDGAQSTYTAVFGPNNILPKSFSLDYSFPDNQSPSVVRVKYLDEDTNYAPSEVLSSSNGGKVREIDFFGCVNYEQAWRESQYLEAQLLRQRLSIKFSTEMAGHIPFYGDLISVQYDLPSWGQGGQIVSKSGTTITTSQPLDWSGSAPFYMAFMKPDGSLSGPHTVTQGSGDYEAILDTNVTDFTFIPTASNQNPTIYQFGPSTNWNKACVVTKVTPKGDNETLDIQCVPYDAAIHTADEGTVDTKPSIVPTGNPIPPNIGGLELTNVAGSGSVVAVWNPLSDIDNYKVQKSTDNSVWTDVSTPSVATETISATGVLYVRVASVIDSIVGTYTKAVIVAT